MQCHFLRPSPGHGAEWPWEEEGEKIKGSSTEALSIGKPAGWGLLSKGYPPPSQALHSTYLLGLQEGLSPAWRNEGQRLAGHSPAMDREPRAALGTGQACRWGRAVLSREKRGTWGGPQARGPPSSGERSRRGDPAPSSLERPS